MEDEIEPLNSNISFMASQKKQLSKDVADITSKIKQCKVTLAKKEGEKSELENDLKKVKQMRGVPVSFGIKSSSN